MVSHFAASSAKKTRADTLEHERGRTEMAELKVRRLAAQLQAMKLEWEIADYK